MAKKLLDKGSDIDYSNGRTIYRAVFHGSIDVYVLDKKFNIIKFLVENGADLNMPHDQGRTPMFFVTHNKDILFYLIENGADLSIKRTFSHYDNENGSIFNVIDNEILSTEEFQELVMKYQPDMMPEFKMWQIHPNIKKKYEEELDYLFGSEELGLL